jgi:hypothetical protein
MFPVNNWAAPDPTEVIVKLAEAPLLVIVPVAVERLLMVLLKPPRSRVAPAATLTALLLLMPVLLPALSVPPLMVVAPL